MKSTDLYNKENCNSLEILEINKTSIFPNFTQSPKIVMESNKNTPDYIMNYWNKEKKPYGQRKRKFDEYEENYKEFYSESENSVNNIYNHISKRIKHWHLEN